MLGVSLLLVLGVVAVLGANLGSGGELRLGYQQLVHARIPWLLLLPLWAGLALGVASLFRRRGLLRGALVGAEGLLAALLSWYFLSLSFLPPHELALELGDPFPVVELADQDGATHRLPPLRKPALTVFYRGDW